MPLDPRHHPDVRDLRGRHWYSVDGIDARDGIQIRALFEARSDEDAIRIAINGRMAGDLYYVPSGVYPEWVRFADSLIVTHTRIILPTPSSGIFLGRLELQRP